MTLKSCPTLRHGTTPEALYEHDLAVRPRTHSLTGEEETAEGQNITIKSVDKVRVLSLFQSRIAEKPTIPATRNAVKESNIEQQYVSETSQKYRHPA